eukprot:GHVS01050764.1.p2 GENE.GHVS01050764.1~~GHVS01050764.1.p2  ORF type:complete len:336 (-),score=116.12 GHVS01050764.1:2449-3456(-)
MESPELMEAFYAQSCADPFSSASFSPHMSVTFAESCLILPSSSSPTVSLFASLADPFSSPLSPSSSPSCPPLHHHPPILHDPTAPSAPPPPLLSTTLSPSSSTSEQQLPSPLSSPLLPLPCEETSWREQQRCFRPADPPRPPFSRWWEGEGLEGGGDKGDSANSSRPEGLKLQLFGGNNKCCFTSTITEDEDKHNATAQTAPCTPSLLPTLGAAGDADQLPSEPPPEMIENSPPSQPRLRVKQANVLEAEEDSIEMKEVTTTSDAGGETRTGGSLAREREEEDSDHRAAPFAMICGVGSDDDDVISGQQTQKDTSQDGAGESGWSAAVVVSSSGG